MADARVPVPLPVEALKRRCDPASFPFETTGDLEVTQQIIGQGRAVQAIRQGLDITSQGFNIFVAGHVGTGRNTTIDQFLAQMPRDKPTPPDLAYVHNFKEPDQPRLLVLAAGNGSKLREAIASLISKLKVTLPAIFESDEYSHERKAVLEGYRERQKTLLKGLEQRVEDEGFKLVQLQMGPMVRPTIVPMVEGEPVGMERLVELAGEGKLEKKEVGRLEQMHETLSEELEDVLKQVRGIDQAAQSRLERLDSDLARPLVHDPLTELRHQFDTEAVSIFLEELEEDILANRGRFADRREGSEPPGPSQGSSDPEPLVEYRVNVIVDNATTKGAPVVNESSPTHKRLFGAVEKTIDRSGEWRSGFMHIKGGSYLKANGGYLVLNASDVLVEPGVWTALKRTLRTGLCEIQSYDPFFMVTASVLKPDSIPCDVKVVLVGSHEIYRMLYDADPEFSNIFKVKAEFDTVMNATPEGFLEYASFIRKISKAENLRPFDRGAAASVVEYGMRRAGRGKRLSTRFTEIADVLREASWRAAQAGAAIVSAQHVKEAIAMRRERVSLARTKIQEMVAEGIVLLDVEGRRAGQVNGLAYYDMGDHAFGMPARITASLSMGRAGIVNIEREAEMSGPTHNKGVLILSGYLRSLFAQDKPLTLCASLCFEQSYGGIDGDSASSAEVYVLLSALAEVPLRQDLAVTGSVNQKGEIQPIGGVNEKIEGWFAACHSRGLTGTQGVLIPALNVPDLMLDDEVLEACRAGRFSVYPVAQIAEGIELLTGLPAGERTGEGAFTEGSVYARADARLRDLAEKIRRFGPEPV